MTVRQAVPLPHLPHAVRIQPQEDPRDVVSTGPPADEKDRAGVGLEQARPDAAHLVLRSGLLLRHAEDAKGDLLQLTSGLVKTGSVQERPWSVEEECSQCLYCWPSGTETALVSETRAE